MASPFFCEGLLEQIGTQLGFGNHLLQTAVFLFQLLHVRHHRRIHAAELAPPLVERGRADAVRTAQVGNAAAAFGLLEYRKDLGIAETGFLHGNLLGKDYEKIPLPTPANLWGDYPAVLKIGGLTIKDQREDHTITLCVAVNLQRSGYGIRMLVAGERATKPDPRLVSVIAKAQALKEKLMSGRYESVETIATELNTSSSYVTRLLRLAFLAPQISNAILEGRQPVALTSMVLLRDTRLPLAWDRQMAQLGFWKG